MSNHFPQVDAWGIMDAYEDGQQQLQHISKRNRAVLRKAMGAAAGKEKTPVEAPVMMLVAGKSQSFHTPAELHLENGKVRKVKNKLPANLPIGCHKLRETGAKSETHLIIHPARCYLPQKKRESGWALQLYALRSRQSWGIGDFADLRRFARWARRATGCDFILLNPLGAPLPLATQEASPYYLSSRLFLNPLYLRVEEVPGANKLREPLKQLAAAGRALNAERLINRDAIFRLKLRALEKIYAKFRGHRAFDRYCAEQGETLNRFASFCVLTERHGGGWKKWPKQFQHPDSPAVKKFAARNQHRVRFHSWLQWLLDEQLARAAKEMPLMLDLPVGINPGGFDAWLWQDALAHDASVGAPPDAFNGLGQNWGLPPFIPNRLRESGYEPFRQTIRAMLRHARGLRIDHVMGLFRLFWIPPRKTAQAGGYVRYHADELLAILAIESQRAKAIIVGEDLGIVERGVRPRLRQCGILSYCLLWFENRSPKNYPPQALAAVTTHDLFTVAGLWSGRDFEAQQKIGMQPNAAGTEAIRSQLRRRTGLSKTASAREVILGAHRLLDQTPCRLITATLDDALAVEERPNMPGTTTQWPNWCIALPKPLEEIQRDDFIKTLFKTIARKGSSPSLS